MAGRELPAPVRAISHTKVSVTVEDYGDGVEDLSQFYDLFSGDKQYDPEKRGRFGRGVKEFIGASDETSITSTGSGCRRTRTCTWRSTGPVLLHRYVRTSIRTMNRMPNWNDSTCPP